MTYNKSIGSLFLFNKSRGLNSKAFAEKRNGKYFYWTWSDIVKSIFKFVSFLDSLSISKGNKVAFVSKNSYIRFVGEMAAISSGAVSVPVFYDYPEDFLLKLLLFSDAKIVFVDNADKFSESFKRNMFFKVLDLSLIETFLSDFSPDYSKAATIKSSDLAVIMFTSGTSGFPKGVMLTHSNIISQQEALERTWGHRVGIRLLSYLPWHHSFGGLFERFFFVYNCGCMAIDDSFGKNISALIRNFKKIKPNVYFSVPKVYQELVERALVLKSTEDSIFHKDLEFVFTAAASLPLSVSNFFKKKNVSVVEGWGLTETSPCCTLTKFNADREIGNVGFPIPGVSLKVSSEGEILVKGKNVMIGYYKLNNYNKYFTQDSWFKTGDIGNLTKNGLILKSRKDRVFKLSNGEKVFPAEIEDSLREKCRFVKYAYVFGSGNNSVSALVFPSFELLGARSLNFDENCLCAKPKDLLSLSKCLSSCLTDLRVKRVIVINSELSLQSGELTPSFKLIPETIEKNYKKEIEQSNNNGDICITV